MGRAKCAQPDQKRTKTRWDGSVGTGRHRGGIGMWAAGTVGLAGHTPGKGTAGDPRMRAPRQQHVLRGGQSRVGFGDRKKGRGIGVLASPRCYWARRSKPVSKLTRTEIGAQRKLWHF